MISRRVKYGHVCERNAKPAPHGQGLGGCIDGGAVLCKRAGHHNSLLRGDIAMQLLPFKVGRLKDALASPGALGLCTIHSIMIRSYLGTHKVFGPRYTSFEVDPVSENNGLSRALGLKSLLCPHLTTGTP